MILNNYNKKIIFYFISCIVDFAEKFDLTIKDAFLYLNKYKGIQYLLENYEIEHIFSKEDTLEALICKKNGGNLK